ncbi:MAG: hypothetical protein WAL84_12870 [Candidatus Dormiibacterota bacterium]
MNMRKATRTALLGPLMVAGGVFALTMGSTNAFAASSSSTHVSATAKTPESSSRPHKHEYVDCDPGHVAKNKGDCRVVFSDPKTKGEPNSVGQTVCFTVSPNGAGSVTTGSGSCTTVGSNHSAVGTFTASGTFCGRAVITATEGKEKTSHHTTVTVGCDKHDATTAAAFLPAGSPQPPATDGWLFGALGVGVALMTGYAVRSRRWRLAAGQSA